MVPCVRHGRRRTGKDRLYKGYYVKKAHDTIPLDTPIAGCTGIVVEVTLGTPKDDHHFTLSGVANYDDLTVNGGTADITIEPYEIPTVKKVSLT